MSEASAINPPEFEQLAKELNVRLSDALMDEAFSPRMAVEQPDDLLEAMRLLMDSHPENAVVREQFVFGLITALSYRRLEAEKYLERRDTLLGQLRFWRHRAQRIPG